MQFLISLVLGVNVGVLVFAVLTWWLQRGADRPDAGTELPGTLAQHRARRREVAP